LCVTKLDILSGLPEIKICSAYQVDGKDYASLPFGLDAEKMAAYKPVYETLPGWQEDISHVRKWEDLPKAAHEYIRRMEMLVGVHVSLISVGPERDQIIRLD
ncbi:MAG: adenylosuccinate synthetase, partial [Leptolinea sp.]